MTIGIALIGCGQIAAAALSDSEVPCSDREVLKVMRTLDLVKTASDTGQTQPF